MTQQMVVGIIVLTGGIGMAASVIVARGKAQTFLLSVLVGEVGAMFLVMEMVSSGVPRTAVAGFFFMSVAWTFIQMLSARRKSRGRATYCGAGDVPSER